jgi:hypothetical protein
MSPSPPSRRLTGRILAIGLAVVVLGAAAALLTLEVSSSAPATAPKTHKLQGKPLQSAEKTLKAVVTKAFGSRSISFALAGKAVIREGASSVTSRVRADGVCLLSLGSCRYSLRALVGPGGSWALTPIVEVVVVNGKLYTESIDPLTRKVHLRWYALSLPAYEWFDGARPEPLFDAGPLQFFGELARSDAVPSSDLHGRLTVRLPTQAVGAINQGLPNIPLWLTSAIRARQLARFQVTVTFARSHISHQLLVREDSSFQRLTFAQTWDMTLVAWNRPARIEAPRL